MGFTITDAKGRKSYREDESRTLRRDAAARRAAPSVLVTTAIAVALMLTTSFSVTDALLLMILLHVVAIRVNVEA